MVIISKIAGATITTWVLNFIYFYWAGYQTVLGAITASSKCLYYSTCIIGDVESDCSTVWVSTTLSTAMAHDFGEALIFFVGYIRAQRFIA